MYSRRKKDKERNGKNTTKKKMKENSKGKKQKTKKTEDARFKRMMIKSTKMISHTQANKMTIKPETLCLITQGFHRQSKQPIVEAN